MIQSCLRPQSRPAPPAFLGGNSRLGNFFRDARPHRLASGVSRGERLGSDGASLGFVSGLSIDPIGFDAGDFNLYRYVANSPLDGRDPSGLVDVPLPEGGSVTVYDIGERTVLAGILTTWETLTPGTSLSVDLVHVAPCKCVYVTTQYEQPRYHKSVYDRKLTYEYYGIMFSGSWKGTLKVVGMTTAPTGLVLWLVGISVGPAISLVGITVLVGNALTPYDQIIQGPLRGAESELISSETVYGPKTRTSITATSVFDCPPP